MAKNLHAGQESKTFVVEGNPGRFINLLRDHGVASRITRSRNCPCVTKTGSPNIFCNLCTGDGFILDYQRKMLQADEDSDIRDNRDTVLPFRVPILEPLRVERMLPEEQGGIKLYNIDSFNSTSITISGDPLPYHWNRMRVSYYFDRYDLIEGDVVDVDVNTKMLTTTQTKVDGEHSYGNVENMHGDITLVNRVINSATGYEYTNYTFRKNVIQLGANEPAPAQGQILVDYYYAKPAPVLPMDLESQNDIEKWITTLQSGNIRMATEPWYELGVGDLITLLPVEYFRDAIISHSSVGVDKLNEFDITQIDDEIFDEDGVKYRNGVDFYLRPFRDLVWIGNQPNAGKKMSVRFGYRPTFSIFLNNPIPNRLENKKYPTVFYAKYFNMTLPKELEQKTNPEYDPDTSSSIPTGSGMVQL